MLNGFKIRLTWKRLSGEKNAYIFACQWNIRNEFLKKHNWVFYNGLGEVDRWRKMTYQIYSVKIIN